MAYNVCGSSGVSKLRVFPQGGGGGGIQQRAIIFPNPSSNEIVIKWNKAEKVKVKPYILRIIDKNGSKVYEKEYNENEISVSIPNLSNGVYYLTLSNGEYNESHQIQIRHD